MSRILAVLTTAAIALGIAAAPAAAGESGLVDVPKLFQADVAELKADSGVDVYLPSKLRVFVRPSRVRGRATAADGSYELQLGVGRNCNGATACHLASFIAIRGEDPGLRRRVTLRGGRTGYWKPITCGASCSPAEIQWVEDGVLYAIATKGVTLKKERATLVKLANHAIKAGPR